MKSLVVLMLLLSSSAWATFGVSTNVGGGGGGGYGGGGHPGYDPTNGGQWGANPGNGTNKWREEQERKREEAIERARQAEWNQYLQDMRVREQQQLAEERQRDAEARSATDVFLRKKRERAQAEKQRVEAERVARIDRKTTFAKDNQKRVTDIQTQANDALARTPGMTAQTEQFLRDQLSMSQTIAQSAVTLAQTDAPESTVKLLADYAYDSAKAVNNFLAGVASGAYSIGEDVGRVMQAIYDDPTLVTNFGNNLINAITDDRIFAKIGNAVSDGLRDLYLVATVGSANEKGQALGKFAGTVVLGLAGAEENALAKTSLNAIGESIVDVGAEAQTLGQNVAQKIEASKFSPLAEEAKKSVHNPLNPGRLSEIPASRVPLDKGGQSIADTYRSGTYAAKETRETKAFYRVQGKPHQIGKDLKRFWTSEKPQGPTQSIIDSALKSNFENNATHWLKIEVPPGEIYYQGPAGPQGSMVGGGDQIFFENVPEKWLKDQGKF
jgi:hypothetical protein